MDSGKIGVVTVLYNGERVLDDFFRSLGEQTYDNFTLYVIDNYSQDRSLAKARALASAVRFETVIIAEPENWGVAKGNNIGIARALADGCEYVLLSNNDIVLAPDTIDNLLQGMLYHEAAVAVPKIYFFDGDSIIWAAGGTYRFWRGGTRHFGFGQKDTGQFDEAKRIVYAPTCFALIHRDVFQTVGMMDEWYFVYYDDTDFMYRTYKARIPIYYIPQSELKHKESSSTGVGSPFTLYYLNRNLLYFTYRHHSFVKLLYTVVTHWGVHLLVHPFLYGREQYRAERKGLYDGLKKIFGYAR